MSTQTRCLLIVPPTGKYIREDRCQTPIEELKTVTLRPPIDLLYVAAILEREKIECRVRDYPAIGGDWETYRAEVREFQPEWVILSVTTPSLAEDVKAARIAKEEIPGLRVGAKGAHFNFSDVEALETYPDLDFCFRGEYEEAAAEALTRGLQNTLGITYRNKESVVRNADRPLLQDLDSLPYPARNLIDNSLYPRPDSGNPQTNIVVSRGCPFSCVFCLGPVISGHKVRRRTPENVLGEIRECVERYGIRDFLFRSDLFTANRAWALALCKAIREEGLEISWGCNSRVDTLDEGLLRAMKESGCWIIAFGVESGSEEMLKRMNKRASREQAVRAVQICRKMDVKSSVYFLIGLPWETEETFQANVEFAKELSPDFLEVFYTYPFKGTEFYRVAVEEGLMQDGETPTDAYSRPAIPSMQLSLEELAGMRRRMLRSFYLRPGYILKTLWKNRSPRVLANYFRYGLTQLWDLLSRR